MFHFLIYRYKKRHEEKTRKNLILTKKKQKNLEITNTSTGNPNIQSSWATKKFILENEILQFYPIIED